MSKQRTAAIYARFSSDLQDKRSVKDQIDFCRNLAVREKVKVIATFCDEAKSGATMFERDGLLDLMKAAKRKAFDVVIVESFSRLSRDPEDSNHIFKHLRFAGVEIRDSSGIVTPVHVGTAAIVNSMFLENLSQAVRRGHDGRVREGKFPGAVTYGYRTVPGKPGEREIEPAEAAIVRRIYSEYADGRSPRAIAAGLNAAGIRAPGGATWNHQTFTGGRHKRGMISNPIYIGRIEWNVARTVLNPETGKRLKRAGKAEDRISAEAPHLRIVPPDLWRRAIAMRQGRAIAKFGPGGKVTRRPIVARNEHMLAGLLRCGTCGGHMRISNTSRDGSSRVACAAAHQSATCQHGKTYDLPTLQTGILDGMRENLTDPTVLGELAKSYHQRRTERAREDGKERATVAKRINRLSVAIDRIVDAIADPDAGETSRALMAKLKPLEAERVGLVERLRLLDAAGNVITLHPGAIDAYVASVSELHAALTRDAMDPAARAAFRNLIDSIVVHPTGKRMPYEVTPYGRLGALLGVDLFPTARSASEMLAAQGFVCSDNVNPEKSGLPISQQVVALGRWRAAA